MDDRLVGKRIRAVFVSDDSRWMYYELMDGERVHYVANGDCCAVAYFFQWENFNDILGDEVLSFEERTVESTANDGDVMDIAFYSLKTCRGEATVEFRVEHNGYYGGEPEFVESGVDQIHDGPWKEIARLWEGERKSVWDRLSDEDLN